MRFMMIIKADANSEAGVMPSQAELEAMTVFNEELVKSGKMLAGEGLHPSSRGARVQLSGKRGTVIDGPFAEAKELIAGFWIIEAASLDEAVDWAKKVPNADGVEAEIEIRQVFSESDFGEALTPELREREDRMRDEIAAKAKG